MTVKIALDRLTNTFPGQSRRAVDELSLDIPEVKIVIVVGPPDCGKTTTMTMVNRLIEPACGRVVLDGEDVPTLDPDRT